MKPSKAVHHFAAAILLTFPISLVLAAGPMPDVKEIIKKSVAATNADWEAAPSYSHHETDHTGNSSKTYEVSMIEGSPYKRLIAINGKPLSQEQQAQEQHKLQQVTSQRKAESASERQERIQKYQKDRRRDHLMMQQLTEAFDFKLIGEKKIGPYDAYVLNATPKPGYKPPNMETQVLTGMRGKMWIDKNTYHWIKVTAQVIHPVSIEGFLAQVQPGTRFELEKMPVEGGTWQPKHFSMKSHAKVLYVFNHSSQEDETYSDYKKQAK